MPEPMELTTSCKCACANCGHIIEYRSSQMGEIVECPKCKEKSQLPEPARLLVMQPHGPEAPEFKNCEVCGKQIHFKSVQCSFCEEARKKRRSRNILLACVGSFVLLVVAAVVIHHFVPVAVEEKVEVKPTPAPNTTIPGGTKILVEQPRPNLPKAISNLHPGRFAVERPHGSDSIMVVGDIENLSQNTHYQLKATVDLLDKTGAKIGTVSDFMNVLGPHQNWHFLAGITDTNVTSAKFVNITEE